MRTKVLFLSFVITFALPCGFALRVTHAWSQPTPDNATVAHFKSSETVSPQSLAVDRSGNLITFGTFSGTTDFDPDNTSTFNLTATGTDGFITKLSPAGTFIWAIQLDLGTLRPNSVAVDQDGDIYVAAGYGLAGDINPDPNVVDSPPSSVGGDDILIAKFNSAGVYLWSRTFGSTVSDIASSIDVDSSGNVYVAGTFQTTIDFDPGADTHNLTSAGRTDIFVLKLDRSGNFIWAKNVGGLSDEDKAVVSISPNGGLVITGMFRGTVDFDSGINTQNLDAQNGSLFLLKLNSLGEYVWSVQVRGELEINTRPVAVDGSDNVYLTGYFNGTDIDFDPGISEYKLSSSTYEVFTLKLSSDGNFLWAKKFGRDSYENSITTNEHGNVVITGYFDGSDIDFDPGISEYKLTSTSYDIYALSLTPAGEFKWAKSFGSTGFDSSRDISFDSFGNIFIAGTFDAPIDFDPGVGMARLTPTGYVDGFILKLDAEGLATNFSTPVPQEPTAIQSPSIPAGSPTHSETPTTPSSPTTIATNSDQMSSLPRTGSAGAWATTYVATCVVGLGIFTRRWIRKNQSLVK